MRRFHKIVFLNVCQNGKQYKVAPRDDTKRSDGQKAVNPAFFPQIQIHARHVQKLPKLLVNVLERDVV